MVITDDRFFILSQQKLFVWAPREWSEDKLILVLKKIDELTQVKAAELEAELKQLWPEVQVDVKD